MVDETTLRNLSVLQYSQLWLESGLLKNADLIKQIESFRTEDDPNKEHYRYQTFRNFLKNQSSLADSTLQQIIEIFKVDEDSEMASSAMIALLKTVYLTNRQFETVEAFLRTYFQTAIKYIDGIKKDRFG
ncbi:MAG: hypothetical protein ABIX01_03385 [Chitinophagaceae bacterium]